MTDKAICPDCAEAYAKAFAAWEAHEVAEMIWDDVTEAGNVIYKRTGDAQAAREAALNVLTEAIELLRATAHEAGRLAELSGVDVES